MSDCTTHHNNQLGLKGGYVIALAGNPNTGKSTIFNALTGLRQHTGNWPGKTITRAEGAFSTEGKNFKLVDLPGTYSLLSASPDEEIARDFILFGKPDVTVIVLDATRLERNLNFALQVLQLTGRAVVCLNLIDEARAHGLEIDAEGLSKDLGVPLIPTSARYGKGISKLKKCIARVACKEITSNPRTIHFKNPILEKSIVRISDMLEASYPELPQKKWLAMRLLEGDSTMIKKLQNMEILTREC